MTREERAIQILEQRECCRECVVENCTCAECDEAFDMAIQALQAQADGEYISKSDMIDWLKDIRSRINPQGFHTASEFEIAENQILYLMLMLQTGALPTVAIPSAEPCEDAISRQAVLDLLEDTNNGWIINEVSRLPSVKPQEPYDFAKWVANEIFDDMWEYNKDSFAEIACRKLEKLGIVRAKGDEWELIEPQEVRNKDAT